MFTALQSRYALLWWHVKGWNRVTKTLVCIYLSSSAELAMNWLILPVGAHNLSLVASPSLYYILLQLHSLQLHSLAHTLQVLYWQKITIAFLPSTSVVFLYNYSYTLLNVLWVLRCKTSCNWKKNK